MRIWCLDDREYDTGGIETFQAARTRGHEARMFSRGEQVTDGGYVFARINQKQPRLNIERGELAPLQRNAGVFTFIQDAAQIACYEDKITQTGLWGKWMPETHICLTKSYAENVAATLRYPFISKSSIGSASNNVRLIKNEAEALAEIAAAWGKGGMKIVGGTQKNYVYWQEYVRADETWRVAIVGTKFHVYKRFNYDTRPMAAPSKFKPTQPVPMSVEVEHLLDWAGRFFIEAGTKWCAIDVLRSHDGFGWVLLETSLAWARGNDAAGNAPFYGTKYSLNTQHELLIEEIEAGVFG